MSRTASDVDDDAASVGAHGFCDSLRRQDHAAEHRTHRVIEYIRGELSEGNQIRLGCIVDQARDRSTSGGRLDQTPDITGGGDVGSHEPRTPTDLGRGLLPMVLVAPAEDYLCTGRDELLHHRPPDTARSTGDDHSHPVRSLTHEMLALCRLRACVSRRRRSVEDTDLDLERSAGSSSTAKDRIRGVQEAML